jgi:phosphoglycolate phosphatase
VPQPELERFLGPPLHETMARLLGADRIDDPRVDAAVDVYRTRYRAEGARETPAVAGMPALVRHLARSRTVAVVTSKPEAFAEPLLTALGLREPFSGVFGPDLGERAEPKATTLERALTSLRLAPADAVLVGDRRFDVEAARAHGAGSIGVTWGIGSRAELEEAGAEAIVDTPAELQARLAA